MSLLQENVYFFYRKVNKNAYFTLFEVNKNVNLVIFNMSKIACYVALRRFVCRWHVVSILCYMLVERWFRCYVGCLIALICSIVFQLVPH